MKRRKKLLVTGAGGFLGYNICRVALEEYDVVGVVNRRPLTVQGAIAEPCDLTDFAALSALFARVRPDAVIHAAAEPQPNICQQDPVKTRKINVDAPLSIASLCNEYGIPCAFTSTDLVFDGTTPPYNEAREVSPISVYGEQKVAAETGMVARHNAVAVCRVPLMYGDAPPNASSFIQPFIRAIAEGRELTLFSDEFRTPTSGASAARGILLALAHAPILLHLGGRESISRFDFAKKLAAAMGRPGAKLTPILQKSIPAVAPRPLDVSFDSAKAYALGFAPLTIGEELDSLECVGKDIHTSGVTLLK